MNILFAALGTYQTLCITLLLGLSILLIVPACTESVHQASHKMYPTVSSIVLPTKIPYAAPTQTVPKAIKNLLMSLPEDRYTLAKPLRQTYLAQPLRMATIPGYGDSADTLLIAGGDKNHFSIWLRSFAPIHQQPTVYLVIFSEDCSRLSQHKQFVPPECKGVTRPGSVRFVSPLRAFYLTDDNQAKEITEAILPPKPLSTLTRQELGQYNPRHPDNPDYPFNMRMDASRLAQAATFRWFIEYDVEQPIGANDTKAYDQGSFAHFGFVVWNGQSFTVQQRVPRSLWPCRPAPKNKATCYHERFGNDPFIEK